MESIPELERQSSVPSAKEDSTMLRYFEPRQYAVICALCELIVPADDACGSATDAGVPDFLDLLVSENRRYQSIFTTGLDWFDGTSMRLFGCGYLECLPAQRVSLLDEIAFNREGVGEGGVDAAIRFFALLRRLTVGGFVTSRIGIEYLRYIGNEQLTEFPGCPVPAAWPGPLTCLRGAEKGEA
jgi:gluconate 2-dehydrogenase gamma chain